MAKIQSASSVAGKETIYVDVDDEITAIIDKVGSAKGKVIALVLPKRAAVLQSIVNMKLLKRTAETAGKNLVLITTEAGLMPLAGSVGMHVASTPTSKPGIPPVPADTADDTEDIDEPLDVNDGVAAAEDFDSGAAAGKTVGELAAAGAAGKIAADDIDESIDMSGEADASADDTPETPGPKLKKNKMLRVPNFDSFRKKLALGGLALVVLVAALIFAFVVLPKATITIKTDSSTISTNLNLTLDTAAKSLETANDTIPATVQSQAKTSTQQAAATGQQNNGDKATGEVTLTNCSKDGSSVTIPTGTSISTAGHTFIIQSAATLSTSSFSGGGACQSFNGFTSKTVDVTALKGGADYNVGASSFTVSGYSAVQAKSSAAMSGGTDDITKVIQQSDIDGATAKIAAADSSTLKQQLTSGLQSKGLQPVPITFVAGAPQVTASAKAGDAVDTVTVTAVTTYTMLGVQKSDLKSLVTQNVTGQLDKGKQVILDDGVANAQFTETSPATATGALVSMSVKSEAGPDLNTALLQTKLAGMKTGDVKNYVNQTPGVTDVSVKYSPFWVSSVPKKSSKITIQIVKAGA